MMQSTYNLEAQLRSLSDDALTQVAQAHQDDALVMAAVLAEKTRRDRLRGGMQSAQAVQQSTGPTVRDHLLAGIAATPVDMNATMADGGIVAFAAGGDTAESDLNTFIDIVDASRLGSEDKSRLKKRAKVAVNKGRGLGDVVSELETSLARLNRVYDAQQPQQNPYQPTYEVDTDGNSSVSSAEIKPFSREPVVGIPLLAGDSLPPEEATAAPVTKGSNHNKIPPGTNARVHLPVVQPVPQKPPIRPLAEPQQNFFLTKTGGVQLQPAASENSSDSKQKTNLTLEDLVTSQFDQLKKAREAQVDQLRGLYAASVDTSTPYAGLEQAYKKMAERDVGRKDKSFYQSLLSAGLGIAGGKSPYALQNIAEGGAEGLASYQSAMKDLEAAEAQRELGLAQIDEARRQQGTLNQQRQFEFESGLAAGDESLASQRAAALINAKQLQDQLAAYQRAASTRASASTDSKEVAQLYKGLNGLYGQLRGIDAQLRDTTLRVSNSPRYNELSQQREQISNQIAQFERKLEELGMPYGSSSGSTEKEISLFDLPAPVRPPATKSVGSNPLSPAKPKPDRILTPDYIAP